MNSHLFVERDGELQRRWGKGLLADSISTVDGQQAASSYWWRKYDSWWMIADSC